MVLMRENHLRRMKGTDSQLLKARQGPALYSALNGEGRENEPLAVCKINNPLDTVVVFS